MRGCQQRGSDRASAKLGGDRQGADQGREEAAKIDAHVGEQLSLPAAPREPFDGYRVGVHDDPEYDEPGEGSEHAGHGPGRGDLGGLAANLPDHSATAWVIAK